jgi:hypothetical protein
LWAAETLVVLATAGADLDATMVNGATPAHLAAVDGRSDALVILHKLGANLQKSAEVGGQELTPIALATQCRQAAAVASLRECISVSHRIVMLQARIRGNRKRIELKKFEERARRQVDKEVQQALEEKRRYNDMVARVTAIQKMARGMLGRRCTLALPLPSVKSQKKAGSFWDTKMNPAGTAVGLTILGCVRV